jgi:hypothetical protein
MLEQRPAPADAFVAARERAEYRLTFTETQPREFHPDCLDGPELPNARDPGSPQRQVGEWYQADGAAEDTEDGWLAHFATMCVAEAVHEALEWFHVDGQPWLDPHGIHEREIQRLCTELADNLAALRTAGIER